MAKATKSGQGTAQVARPAVSGGPKSAAAKPSATSAGARRWWLIAGAGAIVVAAVAGYLAFAAAKPPGAVMEDLGNLHVNLPSERKVEYNSDPPTSGPHFPYIAPWGIHTESVPKELQVHNLEDGGVMVQYHCPSGCLDLVDKLKGIVNRYPEHVILAPYPGMKNRIALTAWTRIDAFDDFDEGRIVRFIQAYRGIDHHKR